MARPTLILVVSVDERRAATGAVGTIALLCWTALTNDSIGPVNLYKLFARPADIF